MSYTEDFTRLNASASLHEYSDFSAGYFEFSTPTHLGEGVTRPSSTEFTLAAGRSYVLIAGICQDDDTGKNWTYWEDIFRWFDGTSYIGQKGSSRTGDSGTGPINRRIQYRKEAVVFIPSSSITTSITVRLRRVSTDTNGSTGFDYTPQATTAPSCAIISIPD
jgi:hypothetical protein